MKFVKIGIDAAMLILLPLLMAYSLVGETAHEWLGIAMFALFVLHHIINFSWLKTLFKGRYSAYRIYMTVINFLLPAVMLMLPVSGIMMSKHIFRISGVGRLSLARTVHLLASYWGFILMSVHAGNHIGAHTAKKKAVSVIFRIIAVVVSIYGVYAFIKRDISSYLFLKNQFVFFDFGQPRLWFFADFTSMICLFACVGAGISKGLNMIDKLKSKENKDGQTKRN